MDGRRLHVDPLRLGVGVLEGKLYARRGDDGSSVLSSVESYDPASYQCLAVASMWTVRTNLGVGVLEGKLYALGGCYGSSVLSSVEAYDPATDQWTAVASMSTRRGALGVGVLEGKLYALGGWDGSSALSSGRRTILHLHRHLTSTSGTDA